MGGGVKLVIACESCSRVTYPSAALLLTIAAELGKPKDQLKAEDLLAVSGRMRCKDCKSKSAVVRRELSSEFGARMRGEKPEFLFGTGIGVKSDPVYHRSSCEWSSRLNSKEMVRFSSRREAEFRGYRPCKTCKPDEAKD